MTELTVTGAVDLHASLVMAGEDISLTVTGGKGHIGSVSIGVPRPSLTGSGSSATVSTFNMTGHKDNVIGDRLAHALAAKTGKTCVVCCGIHMDDAEPGLISDIVAQTDSLLDSLLKILEKEGSLHGNGILV